MMDAVTDSRVLIEGFIDEHVTGQGLDRRTEKAYRLDLEHFYVWLGKKELEADRNLDSGEVMENGGWQACARGYLDYLAEEKKLSFSTISRKNRVLNYYLSYLSRRGVIAGYCPPAKYVRRKREAGYGAEVEATMRMTETGDSTGGADRTAGSRKADSRIEGYKTEGNGTGSTSKIWAESGMAEVDLNRAGAAGIRGGVEKDNNGATKGRAGARKKECGILSKRDADAFFTAMNREYENLDSEFRRRICLRDMVMMELLFYHRIEISELLRMQSEDYDPETGNLVIRRKREGKSSVYLYSRELRRKMGLWLEEREYFRKDGEFEGIMFLSKFGKPLSMEMVVKIFDKYRQLAGIREEFTPRDLKEGVMKGYARELVMERLR